MDIDINHYKPYDVMKSPLLWQKTKYFNEFEEWGDPYKMWVRLIYYIDAFRDYLCRPLVIHCGWELRDSGWHPTGAAVDLHAPGMNYKQLAFKAMQFPFTGIGLYPFWNNPGLHLDVRPLEDGDHRRRMWYRNEKGQYSNLTFQTFLGLPFRA